MSRARSLALTFAIPVLLLMAAQLVPYQKDHKNPPDGVTTSFDSPATRQLAEKACFDCHSNHTKWPWYASIAPISWRIGRHVEEGREKLNFTAFDPANEKMTDAAGEASESITKGDMPPADYLLMHPEARLSATERAALVRGLDVTFAKYGEKSGAREGDSEGAVADQLRPADAEEREKDHDDR